MQEPCGSPAVAAARSGGTADVFAAVLRLGLTSFGGPIAHLCFHEEFVVRRKWLDEKTYVDLVALSQFLPRPASSKVGIAPAAIARRLCGGAGRRGWSSRSARSTARR
jgi:chromate transporter